MAKKATPNARRPRAAKAPAPAAPTVTLEQATAVADHYRTLLMGVPGVKAVVPGLKERKRRYAHQLGQPDEFCVIVFVEAKRTRAKGERMAAHRQQPGTIPETLDGVPTDIRPVPRLRGAATLAGGMQVESTTSNGSVGISGTVTIVATHGETGTRGFVTAAHVAIPPGGKADTDVFHPTVGGQGRVGVVVAQADALDCAFVATEDGEVLLGAHVVERKFLDAKAKPCPINVALRPPVAVGDKVFHVGMVSQKCAGKVVQHFIPTHVPIEITGPDGKSKTYSVRGLMQIAGADGKRFCQFGDSGAPILMPTDDGLALVGLLVAMDDGGKNGYASWWGMAGENQGVADALGVTA